MPPFLHFKKKRNIRYSLSRISTVIMGFYSQYVVLLQEKNRGHLMAMFSGESWVILEPFPPKTNSQYRDGQSGESKSTSGLPNLLFNNLTVLKAHILNLSTFFKLTFPTFHDLLLRHPWWITQNRMAWDMQHNLTTCLNVRKPITFPTINKIRPDHAKGAMKHQQDWRFLWRSHTHYSSHMRKRITALKNQSHFSINLGG